MKKILLTSILLTGIVFPQGTELSKGLGFAAGMPSGVGFSYRQINEKNGFQINGGAVVTGYNSDYGFEEERTDTFPNEWKPSTEEVHTVRSWDNKNAWANIGFTYIKPLHRAERSQFYAFASGSTYYNSEKYQEQKYQWVLKSDSTYTYTQIGDAVDKRDTEFDIFVGIGLGLDFQITENIRLALELPLTVSDEGHIWMIIPQGGIHYYFK